MNKFRVISIVFLLSILLGVNLHAQDMKNTVDGNNAFTFSIFDEINNEEANVFFSPYSISSALAMTYNGAEGKTREEMASVLNFPENKHELSVGFKRLNEHLHELQRDDIQLKVANSLWGEQTYSFRQEFLDINKEYYKAGIRKVDFKNNYNKAREDINKWVEENTEEKIKDLIPPGMLDAMTRMVLANAIYFKGAWEFPFDEKKTRKDTFYIYTKCRTKADFMNRSLTANYYKDNLAEVLEIPYSGGEISMLIVLPHETYGMEKLESKLDRSLYEKYNQELSRKQVELSLPKFNITADYELSDVLSKLGMKTAFGGDADFSGMTGKKELYISNIVHKSFVDVNEEGTEAAAATGVVMRKTSLPPSEKIKFKADHPFIFFIKDNETNSVLFMGRVMNPNE
ncbi:MAG: serpin family protein [Bacteroidales bacterium]